MREVYASPDGQFAVVYSGDLASKIAMLAEFGIAYTPTAEEVEAETAASDMREQYLTAMNQLQAILNEPDPTAVNLALAIRIVQGMRTLARVEKQILILLKQQYT